MVTLQQWRQALTAGGSAEEHPYGAPIQASDRVKGSPSNARPGCGWAEPRAYPFSLISKAATEAMTSSNVGASPKIITLIAS